MVHTEQDRLGASRAPSDAPETTGGRVIDGLREAVAGEVGRVTRVKIGVWPDFIAPPKYENPDPRWTDPRLPDFRLIWKVARECGYSVGLHGSMRRDCDLIAAPWTDEALHHTFLLDELCRALDARIVGGTEEKPHGRRAYSLQVDGYVKLIDLSIMPLRGRDEA